MGVSWQESQSFMAGKSEKQGLGLRQGATIIKNVKKFYITTEICGGSEDTGSDDNDDR